jgi:hypothetical protein
MIDKDEAPNGFEAISDGYPELGGAICERCDYESSCLTDPDFHCTSDNRKDGKDVVYKKIKKGKI